MIDFTEYEKKFSQQNIEPVAVNFLLTPKKKLCDHQSNFTLDRVTYWKL